MQGQQFLPIQCLRTRQQLAGAIIDGGRALLLLVGQGKDTQRQKLIDLGKEKGYLLYDEISDLLPPEVGASAEDLGDLFSAFGTAGIEVIATANQNFAALDKIPGERKFDAEATEEGIELDLTPGALEKANDPVRMYLREMGTVPLLTRAGEVEIASASNVDSSRRSRCYLDHP